MTDEHRRVGRNPLAEHITDSRIELIAAVALVLVNLIWDLDVQVLLPAALLFAMSREDRGWVNGFRYACACHELERRSGRG